MNMSSGDSSGSAAPIVVSPVVAASSDPARADALNQGPDPFAQGVSHMFGRIAGAYDLLNRLLSGGLDIYWREALAKELLREREDTSRVLDLATGTFDVALSLRRRSAKMRNSGLQVAALDLCTPMLRAGKPKLAKSGAQGHIWPVTANGLYLPLAGQSVDLACISFGIRNIKPRQGAFSEFYRVLKPGGKLCVLEFGSSRKPIWGGLYNFYLGRILPRLGRLVSGDGKAYHYLAESIRDFASAPELAGEMREAGFERVGYRSLNGGIVYLHYGYKAV